ncbi:MAG TPA: SDR family NAD(P)-dependent oxidoreductase [Armatimonadota bacterium]|jgi:predicted amino acid dehydrogenase
MEKFAFVIHPLDARKDVARKYPIARYLPEQVVEFAIKFSNPQVVGHCTGIRAANGAEAEGWFVACPLSARQMLELPTEFVYDRIVQCGMIAADLGAGILGLGAFTSVVGDAGVTIASRLPIAVTTGNSYTVATAIEAAVTANQLLGRNVEDSVVAVVGATGSIGRTCAMVLGRDARSVTLVGRTESKLNAVAGEVRASGAREVTTSTDVKSALKAADIVVTVTSAVDTVIHPADLKSGAVVCDVARPRDVSVRVVKERPDVLVIEGGVVKIPGDHVDLNFSFGFEPGTAYACMSETMMLALAGRYESFTLGKTVSVEQVRETQRLAQEQGFKLAGFRSFERPVTDETIESVKKAIAAR